MKIWELVGTSADHTKSAVVTSMTQSLFNIIHKEGVKFKEQESSDFFLLKHKRRLIAIMLILRVSKNIEL